MGEKGRHVPERTSCRVGTIIRLPRGRLELDIDNRLWAEPACARQESCDANTPGRHPPFSDSSTSQAGLLMSLFALIVAASGPFLVLLSSRHDRKKILVGALFSFSICSVLSAYTPSYSALMALRVLPALLHPIFFSAAFAAAVSLYPKERATHATTTAFIGTTLGLVFGVPLTTLVADLVSYEAAILFCAAATLLAGVGLWVQLPRQTRLRPASFGNQLAILRRPSVWLAIAATVFVFTTKFAFYSYAAEFLRGSTRSVTLTAEGMQFLERSRRILAEIEAAEAEMSQSMAAPRGA